MIYGTFLFSKNFWTHWDPPNSRGMKLDPLPWSNEVQNTNNPTTTASRAPRFYTETNRPHSNTKSKNSPYIQHIQRPLCVRNEHKTYILSSVKKLPGIRWYNLKELLLSIKRCTLISFVAVGMRQEGNVPKNGEPAVAVSFTTMLQHTGRVWSMIS